MANKGKEVDDYSPDNPKRDRVLGGHALHLFFDGRSGLLDFGQRVLEIAHPTLKLAETTIHKITAASTVTTGLMGILRHFVKAR